MTRRRAETRIERVAETSNRLADAVRRAQRELARIERSERLSAEAKLADRQAAEERLREAADRAEARINEALEEVDDIVGAWTRPDDGDPQRALVAESRLSRAWERTRRLLDAGEDAVEIAQRAARDGDRDTIAALRAELPAFMAAKGERAYADGFLGQVEEAASELSTPAEQAASEVRAAAERAARNARLAVSIVRKDGLGTDAIPGPDDSMIEVGEAA